MSYRLDPDTLALEEEAAGENFIVRHWRGHLSLPVSWFVVGILLSTVVVAMLAAGVAAVEASATSLRLIAIAWVTFFIFFAIVRIWATVGIWRSAGFHEVRGGSAGWATVAKFLLVVGIIGSLGQARSYALQVSEYGQLAMGTDPIGAPAKVSVANKGHTIKLDGPLTLGTADRVRQVAAAMPDLRTVQLNSRGGRIFEAMRLADLVRERKLGTSVPRTCESACTLVLLAGKNRTAATGARVGFHQPDFPGYTADERRAAIATNSRQYVEAGIDSSFISRMMETPPTSMWYPSHQELIQAGVIDGDEIVVTSGTVQNDWLVRRLAWEAANLNKSAPVTLDEYTVLKSARAKGHELYLLHRLKTPVVVSEAKAAKPSLTASIKQKACGDESTRELIEAGATFTYHYDQSNGQPLYDISIGSCG